MPMNSTIDLQSVDEFDLVNGDRIANPDNGCTDEVILTVTSTDSGLRLDKFLATKLPDQSRTRLKHLVLDGAVTVGGIKERDPNRKLLPDTKIVLRLPQAIPAKPQAEAIPLEIIFEDTDLILINKPAGLVVHPAAGHASGTLVNALIAHCGPSLSGIGGVKRPGIVHRLDKDTSGLLVVAKHDRSHKKLADQFADHGRTGPLERSYRAIIWGVPDRKHGTIEAPIDRSAKYRDRMTVVKDGYGRDAITHYEVLETFLGADGTPVASLVGCHLQTGRTHQIRVHMTHIGHPLIGDAVYGTGFKTKISLLPEMARETVQKFPRQALHAAELGFAHPKTGDVLHFRIEDPPDFADLLRILRKSSLQKSNDLESIPPL